jgi:hypothetical protein
MPVPVKISDRLLAMAKEEAGSTHRSATAQIEHWATLGRGVEMLVAYAEVLALKKAGQVLPIPPFIQREEMHDLLMRIVNDGSRAGVQARIRASETPLYTMSPDDPRMVVEIEADGTRVPGHLEGRRFVPTEGESAAPPS